MTAVVAARLRGLPKVVSRPWTLAGGALVGALVALALVVVPALDRQPEPAVDTAAYHAAIKPTLDRGASVVGYGLRPGLADIAARTYPDERLQSMADGWVAALRGVRDDFADLDAPRGLDAVHALYARSLETYVRAAEAAAVAAETADDPGRRRSVERAASLGRSADRQYEQAEAALVRLGPIRLER